MGRHIDAKSKNRQSRLKHEVLEGHRDRPDESARAAPKDTYYFPGALDVGVAVTQEYPQCLRHDAAASFPPYSACMEIENSSLALALPR